jgi:TetR/AcrR family transcriptional regulator, regulator of autoinduction and epiphytic fitness
MNPASPPPPSKPTFHEQVFQVREAAIVAAVNRILSEKGFELMSVDAVAAEVGIGKASLYKHFDSKEALAAAAMAFVLESALVQAARLDADASLPAIDRIRSMARWAVERQLSGEMPALPMQNPGLRSAMAANRTYLDRLTRLGDQMGVWIEAARAEGQLDPALPAEMTLYALFTKGCDPVVFIMKESGQYSDAQITDWAVRACFSGLAGAGLPAKSA